MEKLTLTTRKPRVFLMDVNGRRYWACSFLRVMYGGFVEEGLSDDVAREKYQNEMVENMPKIMQLHESIDDTNERQYKNGTKKLTL